MTIKLLICGRRRLGRTVAETRSHLRDVHGAMVLDYIAKEPSNAPRRYVQNHVFDGIYFGGEGQPNALMLGLDFVTQVWFPDLGALKASRETPFYIEKLQPDEPNMVDEATLVGVPVSEEVFSRPEPREGAAKVFLFWLKGVPDAAVLAEAQKAVGGVMLGHARNTPLFPGPVQAIDEVWLTDDASALAFAQAARDTIRRTDASGQAAFCLAVAREFVLHAG